MTTQPNPFAPIPNPFPAGHKWTINQIAQRNQEHGWKWFDADTLRWFGDNMTYFSVVQADGKIYVKRVKNARKKPASVPSEIGKLYLFDPETGRIVTITNDLDYDAADRADIPAALLKGNKYYAR